MCIIGNSAEVKFNTSNALGSHTVQDGLIVVTIWRVQFDWQLIGLVLIVENIFNRGNVWFGL